MAEVLKNCHSTKCRSPKCKLQRILRPTFSIWRLRVIYLVGGSRITRRRICIGRNYCDCGSSLLISLGRNATNGSINRPTPPQPTSTTSNSMVATSKMTSKQQLMTYASLIRTCSSQKTIRAIVTQKEGGIYQTMMCRQKDNVIFAGS